MSRAKRRCGRPGCDELMPCTTHTPKPWAGSTRRADLPSSWAAIRRRILIRDPWCTLKHEGCLGASVEVDHMGERTDHRDHRLRGVCHPCHIVRTRAQARAARAS